MTNYGWRGVGEADRRELGSEAAAPRRHETLTSLTSLLRKRAPESGAQDPGRIRTRSFALGAGVYGLLGVVWGTLYLSLGLTVPALIPYGYVVLAAITLGFYSATGRLGIARTAILLAWLALPFLLQLTLGGFVSGSAVVLWGLAAPIGALFFAPRQSSWWALGFLAVIVAAWLVDPLLTPHPGVTPQIGRAFFALNLAGVSAAVFFVLRDFLRRLDHAREELELEREKSESLLRNLLPEPIAERLKRGEKRIADRLEEVTIVFADLVGFTSMSEGLSPDEVVDLLGSLVADFDRLVDRYQMEKIRTIGDAYMAVAGAPEQSSDHLERAADMALEMVEIAHGHTTPTGHRLDLRVGIDSGPVVAGVIGIRKFVYDVWGDTVNTASRMESHGVAGRIQVTPRVHDGLQESFRFDARGPIDIKGKGPMMTYFLMGRLGEDQPAGGMSGRNDT